MDKYEELKGKIAEFVLKDDVVEDEETISAYSLVQAMNDKLSKLHHVRYVQNKELTTKINNALKKKYSFAFRKKNEIQLYENVLIQNDYKKKRTAIVFLQKNSMYSVALYRDIDDPDYNLYSDSRGKVDDCIIDTCLPDLLSIFTTMEDFYKLFVNNDAVKSEENDGHYIYDFVNDGFEVVIAYNDYGRVSYKVRFTDSIDPDKVQERTWYGDRVSINNILKACGGEILKKVPVKTSQLHKISKSILEEQRLEKQKTMQ